MGKKALFIGKSLTKLSGAAEARQADRHRPSTAQSSSRPSPTGYLVLMLEPQLLVACQQHCCRALFLHDGPRAARTTMRNALAVSRTLLAVFAPRVLRVSAAARRGAAAYADGDQRMVRARTHQSGLVRPPQSEIRWAFLHNFLRTRYVCRNTVASAPPVVTRMVLLGVRLGAVPRRALQCPETCAGAVGRSGELFPDSHTSLPT